MDACSLGGAEHAAIPMAIAKVSKTARSDFRSLPTLCDTGETPPPYFLNSLSSSDMILFRLLAV